jgi:hypothetical protein
MGFGNDCIHSFISVKENQKLKTIKHNYSQFDYDSIIYAYIWLGRKSI